MAAIIAVFELPPKLSLRSHVKTYLITVNSQARQDSVNGERTESRYGTNSSALPFFFLPASWLATASVEMTLPSVVRDLLILAPSLRRWPVAPVELARSDPAKSTRLPRKVRACHKKIRSNTTRKAHLIRETFSVSRFVSTSCRLIVRRSVNTACDRDDLVKREVG
jgi:hypothetical protein